MTNRFLPRHAAPACALLLTCGALLGCATPPSGAAATPAAPAAATPTETAMRSAAAPATVTRVASNDGTFLVLYRTRPEPIPVGERFTIEATVHDPHRGESIVRDVDLAVDAAMPHHRHGMNVVPTVRRQNDGSFVATGMLFHMPGRWEIYFDVTRGLVTERAQCEVWVE